MQVNKVLLRYARVIFAVVLSCKTVHRVSLVEASDERKEIGFVSQKHGSWVDQRSGLRLQVGDRIYVDSQLQRGPAQSADDYIAVTFHGLSEPVSFACKDGIQCRT